MCSFRGGFGQFSYFQLKNIEKTKFQVGSGGFGWIRVGSGGFGWVRVVSGGFRWVWWFRVDSRLNLVGSGWVQVGLVVRVDSGGFGWFLLLVSTKNQQSFSKA